MEVLHIVLALVEILLQDVGIFHERSRQLKRKYWWKKCKVLHNF